MSEDKPINNCERLRYSSDKGCTGRALMGRAVHPRASPYTENFTTIAFSGITPTGSESLSGLVTDSKIRKDHWDHPV